MKTVTAKVITTFTQTVTVQVENNASEDDIKTSLIESSSLTSGNTELDTEVHDIEVVA